MSAFFLLLFAIIFLGLGIYSYRDGIDCRAFAVDASLCGLHDSAAEFRALAFRFFLLAFVSCGFALVFFIIMMVGALNG